MAIIIYNGKSLTPAPQLNIRRENKLDKDGLAVTGVEFSITLTGRFVAYKGSPTASGTLWGPDGEPPTDTAVIGNDDAHLSSILKKQKAVNDLFNDQKQLLRIRGWDGNAELTCYPTITQIDFPAGQIERPSWYNVADYTVSMTAPNLYLNGIPLASGNVAETEESWSIEPADDRGRTFRLTHSLSANGNSLVNPSGSTVKAWEAARDYVLGTLGLGLESQFMTASGVLWNGTSLQAYNYSRQQNVNLTGGTFSATESWLCFDPGATSIPAMEEYDMEVRVGEDGNVSASVKGTITGLEVRNNTTGTLTTDRWTGALAKWAEVRTQLYARACSGAGIVLPSRSLNTTISENPLQGTLGYSVEYSTSAGSVTGISDAISDTITVSDSPAIPTFAEIPIPLRAAGPSVQDIGTQSSRERNISIEITMPAPTGGWVPTQPNTDAIVLANRPVGTLVWLTGDQETWSLGTGGSRYSRNTTYRWQS